MALFGTDATEAISLDELNTSKYALGYLRRARMCISSETNPSRTTTELTKKISGSDWLSSDVKNRDRVRFRAFTQLMFDSNSMPIFEDNSVGFQRRFTRVNMPYTFCDNPSGPMEKRPIGIYWKIDIRRRAEWHSQSDHPAREGHCSRSQDPSKRE